MIAPSTIVGGRYRVVRSLGGGGMKLVYLAEDLRLAARPCALAEMVDSFTSPDLQQQAVAAFQREADMLAQLANEHIPRIFDRFSEANHHYLVMEYIDGTTLEDELRAQGGKLPPAQVIEIALQILTTLEYLHNLDPPVIYRDLKPSNVMVTRGGMAKLIDFGIARHFAPLTNATMIGTQGYAPPEQYRGRVETRSDLYALGATMHHALSGRDPAAEAPFSFPSLRKLCPDLDPALAAVVDQALAYDVVNRMRDATEFKRRLIEIKNGASEPVKPASTPGNRSSVRPQLPLPLGNASMASGGGAATPANAASQGARSMPASGSGAGESAGSSHAHMSRLQAAASASSPTVLSVNSEIKCPSCTRMIPLDSRFCSYCAVDLRHSTDPFQLGGDAEAETVILNGRQWNHRTSGGVHDRTQTPLGGKRPRRGLRHPLAIIAAIFAISFLIKMFLLNEMTPAAPSGDESGSAAPPGATAPEGDATAPDAIGDTRLAALRQALDDAGYRSVRFRLNGDVLEVWGTVPDEFDRAAVQTLILSVGIVRYQDNMRVHDEYAEP
jgi:serine/threonine protein kinase